MERRYFLLTWGILALATVCAAQPADVYLNCTAVSETGESLAKGTFRIGQKDQIICAPRCDTRGQSVEPAPMYMLFSYIFAPVDDILLLPRTPEETWEQRIGKQENGKGRARTVLDANEPISVPAGTFREVRKYRTTVSDAEGDSRQAIDFINGVRYMWFAKGVGLVRMRYEHSNGIVTEAVLLSHKLAVRSDDYLPLQVGNRWTYAWKNDYRETAVIETCMVSEWPQDLDPESRAPAQPKPAVDSNSVRLDASADSVVRIAPSPERGFRSPYYLFVPRGLAADAARHMLVEMNNTGTTSDDLAVHDESAERLVRDSYANQMARKLQAPLLVPVFPRPKEQWQAYTHSLDEDTLKIVSGPLARIDLQLIAMIRDAQALLRRNGIEVRDKVFMHGYSASGVFTNRFAILHPDVVRAVAAGGVNGIPTFPTAQWQGTRLAFPVGIADTKDLIGVDFDEPAYKQVSQYIYMGYLDRNDTTLSRDAFCEEHAQLIRSLIGADMGKRWLVSQSIYRELGVPAQCVTYNGSGHEIKPEMIEDVVAFFEANSGDGFVPIRSYEYPFVEFREIKTAHINGLYWQGDERIPEWCRDLSSGKGHFIMTIDEWMEGQDHRQLDAFTENAGFEFLLKADGHDDVRITSGNSHGNCSAGHGNFQGFVVRLEPSQLDRIARGVEYTLTPVDPRPAYVWQVKDSLRLVRP
ncbi:MAG: hypothetical protein ACM3VT_01645 [Solirubrobacterales bacterium]